MKLWLLSLAPVPGTRQVLPIHVGFSHSRSFCLHPPPYTSSSRQNHSCIQCICCRGLCSDPHRLFLHVGQPLLHFIFSSACIPTTISHSKLKPSWEKTFTSKIRPAWMSSSWIGVCFPDRHLWLFGALWHIYSKKKEPTGIWQMVLLQKGEPTFEVLIYI